MGFTFRIKHKTGKGTIYACTNSSCKAQIKITEAFIIGSNLEHSHTGKLFRGVCDEGTYSQRKLCDQVATQNSDKITNVAQSNVHSEEAFMQHNEDSKILSHDDLR